MNTLATQFSGLQFSQQSHQQPQSSPVAPSNAGMQQSRILQLYHCLEEKEAELKRKDAELLQLKMQAEQAQQSYGRLNTASQRSNAEHDEALRLRDEVLARTTAQLQHLEARAAQLTAHNAQLTSSNATLREAAKTLARHHEHGAQEMIRLRARAAALEQQVRHLEHAAALAGNSGGGDVNTDRTLPPWGRSR